MWHATSLSGARAAGPRRKSNCTRWHGFCQEKIRKKYILFLSRKCLTATEKFVIITKEIKSARKKEILAMLTFDFTYSTKMTLIFNDSLEITIIGSLNDAIEKINWACQNYPFTEVDVIDYYTGEILITARNR